jgi:hypothetical protein
VPQNRQGVFFHVMPPYDGSKLFQAPKLIPGNNTAAAVTALCIAADFMNCLLLISICDSLSCVVSLPVRMAEFHAKGL